MPQDFAAQVQAILCPPAEEGFAGQYAELMGLIDEVLALADVVD